MRPKKNVMSGATFSVQHPHIKTRGGIGPNGVESFAGKASKDILSITKDGVILAAVDGIDPVLRRKIADKLAEMLGSRPVLRLSLDCFHSKPDKRYLQGEFSWKGYYDDAFDVHFLIKNTLQPLTDGLLQICPAVHDYYMEERGSGNKIRVKPASIVILDGPFLHKPKLAAYWDYSVYIHLDPQDVYTMGIQRDEYAFNNMDTLIKKYKDRYVPAHKYYVKQEQPEKKASLCADFSNLRHLSQTSDQLSAVGSSEML